MSTMNQEAMVLKSDQAGRVQTPVNRQIAVVREYERSGLSGPRFAALTGINYQTFVTWRRKHGVGNPSRKPQPAKKVAFVEAVISAGALGTLPSQATAALVMELTLTAFRAGLHRSAPHPCGARTRVPTTTA